MSKALKHFAPAICWGLLVLILSTLPGNDLPHLEWGDLLRIDKIVHLTFYSVFVFLLLNGSIKSGYNKPPYRSAFLFCITFGASMELIQKYFCIGRSFEWLDILSNTIGSLIGGWSFRSFWSNRKK